MKKFLKVFLSVMFLLITGCEYDDRMLVDRVDNLEERVSKLETLCNQMNTNISSLQTIVSALQQNDYITSVVPITEGDATIGYTISFVKSDPITIYHGQDGKDGQDGTDGKDGQDGTDGKDGQDGAPGKDGVDGKDGYTPVIGVKQDTDNIYYWTLDGEWLLDDSGSKIKAVGTDGKDGENGANGQDGKDGQDGEPGAQGPQGESGADGKDGTNGITPQLKIEGEYWYISYDNGTSWSQLGRATGSDGKDGQDGIDGTDGKDGKDGDSFFQSVDTSSEDYVIFTLSNGTMLQLPTWYAFEQLKTLCNEMNTNITSIQSLLAAVENRDYVTSCTPYMANGTQIGYTISFAKGNSIVIYHGQDGKDGQDGTDGKDGQDGAPGKDGVDGKDGYTPVIGVKQDTDNIYYWTLDGEWLLDDSGSKIKAVGTDGKDGANGQDGTPGVQGPQGEPGADGKDGITPMLKIENDYWYISYDNGTSWTPLGKATGEDGKDGKDGDSFFQSVTQDESNVYFTLADGTVITLPKGAALNITFDSEDLVVMPTNSTREIGYTVTSSLSGVKVEAIGSGDIKAKAVSSSELSGVIKVTTGATIDEYSKVVVLVSNGEKVVMKTLTFEKEEIKVENEATVTTSADGGEVELLYLSNVECEVIIPDSVNWVSIVPTTRALEQRSVKLLLEENKGAAREAVVTLQNKDASLKLEYTISQNPSNDYQLALEREALIAIYNALDGDNWTNNENWCSNKPVSEWYGVYCKNGHVDKLWLTYNNLNGDIPDDIGVLSYLTEFMVSGNNIYSLSNELEKVIHLKKLAISNTKIKSLSFSLRSFLELEFLQMQEVDFESFPEEIFQITTLKELGYLYQPISPLIGNLNNLENLTIGHTSTTTIPKELFNCTKLKHLSIDGLCVPNYTLTGEIPSEIGNLKELESLLITNAQFTGGIPESISNLNNLKRLHLRKCNIGGEFPCDLLVKLPNLTQVSLEDNGFTGTISEEFASTDLWKNGWRWICMGNRIELQPSILYGPVPKESVYDNNGEIVDFVDIYNTNKYTIVFNWAYWCPTSQSLMEMLVGIYDRYHEKGVDIIGIYGDGYSESRSLLKSLGAQWRNIEMYGYNDNTYCLESPYVGIIDVVDSSGHVVFNHIDDEPYNLEYWLKSQLNVSPDYYTSTDYSQDGVVSTLQTATKGDGIDVVLMGDAYSDRQIADGTYKTDMENIYDNLFTEEPYKSFKDHFNVHYVNVVSATEGYEYGNTALDGYFGDATLVGGNDNAVFDYALKAISEQDMDEALIIVAMNSDAYAGTCYMYYPESSTSYGSGPSVSYFPKGGETETFAQLLHHEACGHGFAKLADEYAYESMGTVPNDYASQIKEQQTNWGWWKNVDFSSTPSETRWSHFINDTRYANEGLGAYEGGLTYWTGVWRPTENSIMRYNTGGFNAPSREAIYYRIHKLAYGDSWEYDYEEFVEWDARNRSTSSPTTRVPYRVAKPRDFKPTAPPVIIRNSWRDAK